ncbi:t-snare, syntaxin [Terfezia claveryi]|nr:t-snare, syntaxin [Terfezia claveryi]
MRDTSYGGSTSYEGAGAYAGNPDVEAQPFVHRQQQYGNLDFHDFLSQVTTIQNNIANLSQNVTRIAGLHNQTLQSYDTGSASSAQLTAQLESLVAETSLLNSHIRDDIKFLERDSKFPGDPQGVPKRQQVDKLKKSFDQELKNYQLMESQYRGQYRAQMERQYRIVKPDATQEEVEQAVQSGETQILSSARSSNAQSTLGAVKARHAEILRIERTLIELVELFEEMAKEVEAAEPVVAKLEKDVENVHQDLVIGNTQLVDAKKHAWNTRRNKWICLGIVVVLIAIIALILGLKFGRPNNNNSSNSGNSNNGP